MAIDTWLSWQLADSAFPSGGFAHSLGIEAAQQQGFLSGENNLQQAAQAILQQQGCTSLPLLAETYRRPDAFQEMDALCHTLLNNHTARNASIAQGRALARAAVEAFPDAGIDAMELAIRSEQAHGHLPAVFGSLSRSLGMELEQAAHLYLFQTLRSLMSAAVRLSIVGALRAQALTRDLTPSAQEAVATGLSTSIEEVADPLPLLNVLQGNQDRLYSRLFQS